MLEVLELLLAFVDDVFDATLRLHIDTSSCFAAGPRHVETSPAFSTSGRDGGHTRCDLAHNVALRDHLSSNGHALARVVTITHQVFILSPEHVSVTLLSECDLALSPGRLMDAEAERADPLPIAVSRPRDSH